MIARGLDQGAGGSEDRRRRWVTQMMLIDEWWSVAACRDAEPELFFPISATSASSARVTHAKLICASCQVRSNCLRYALDHRQEHGIWGGLTEEERRRIPRRSLQFTGRDA